MTHTDLRSDTLPTTVRDFLGLADLDYRFTLRGDLVAELVIASHEA